MTVFLDPSDTGHDPPDDFSNGSDEPAAAIICHEGADSRIGERASQVAAALARRGWEVHLYGRTRLSQPAERLWVHQVPASDQGDLWEQTLDFCAHTCSAIRRDFGTELERVVLLGHEWASIPVLLALAEAGATRPRCVLSLESLERQRSDMTSAQSARIEQLEVEGLERADAILVAQGPTAEQAQRLVPSCSARLSFLQPAFPIEQYPKTIDPGAIKARYQVGPLDPMLLFVGDLDERHGADLVLRAMPAIVKNTPSARLVVVGEGHLRWPLRGQARHLRVDPAVRIVGHVAEREVRELIAACDLVVVPSRTRTEHWPILAAWAARRPVVVTHNVGGSLCGHEHDGVLVYASPESVVWGIERVLHDPALGERIGQAGHARLAELHCWGASVERLERLVDTTSSHDPAPADALERAGPPHSGAHWRRSGRSDGADGGDDGHEHQRYARDA